MDTARLRDEFLVEDLFAPGELRFVYTHVDRMILGGAVPLAKPLVLRRWGGRRHGTVLHAREMGIANLGGAGSVTIDGSALQSPIATSSMSAAAQGASNWPATTQPNRPASI
jgi:4-deoxy-L-threo-5-hexosulose-uronate ketol-isomerase